MFEGRLLDHIGIACLNPDENARWYMDKLNFTLKGRFPRKDDSGFSTWFVTNGPVTYEIYSRAAVPEDARGKVDHIALVSDDIESDYRYCVDNGYTICSKGIESIPDRFANGVRYFKVKSPMGEEVEFSQTL